MIVVAQANTNSSFFCQREMFSSNAFCRNVLNTKLDRGSPCLVPFLISTMSLPPSVITVAFWSLYNFFRKEGVIMFDTARFEGAPN